MIDPRKIAIVIPVHNRKHFTLALLHSLARQTVSNFRVIIGDDGSTDGTAQAIAESFPLVTVLRGDGNLWWSATMNLGIEHALREGMDYIISLNNDLEVAENYLEKMIFWAERNPRALLGSYSFDIATRQPSYGGEQINWKTGKTINFLNTLPEKDRQGLVQVTHFPGRGLWIPAEIFRQIGLFDARWLPHYGADYDFTLRACGQGYKVYCNFDARLFSHVKASGDAENRQKFSWKNYFNNLFSIKGGGNLKNFTILAVRHCPARFFLYYWAYGMAARMGGYLRDWYKMNRQEV